MPAAPRGPVGFLDALRGDVLVGWARDPQDPSAIPTVRLMRGVEVLAECQADVKRDDGMPGFRLRSPVPLRPEDLLEGRVRVRAVLPGRHAAVTLAMSLRMRAALEAAAGWEPTTEVPSAPIPPSPPQKPARPTEPVRRLAPEPPHPPPSARRVDAAAAAVLERPAPPPPAAEPEAAPTSPSNGPEIAVPEPLPVPEPVMEVAGDRAADTASMMAAPVEGAEGTDIKPEPPSFQLPGSEPAAPEPVAAEPVPAGAPLPEEPAVAAEEEDAAPAGKPVAPVLRPLQAMAEAAEAAGISVLHLALPSRVDVLAPEAAPDFMAMEAEAAGLPLLARDWVPLRAAFGRDPNPSTLWRRDGRRLSVEGGFALLAALLSVLRVRLPAEAAGLARAEAILSRADLVTLPRRHVAQTEGEALAFLGVTVWETEPALTEAVFANLPQPRQLSAQVGLEAWHCPGAPLPWRVLLLASPGLGGSASPAALGWWLRYLVAECVLSEALPTAPPAAALAVQPGLILTLSDATARPE